MIGKVGGKTVFHKNCCVPLSLLYLFIISSSRSSQPGEGCSGWLPHVVQTATAWGVVCWAVFILRWPVLLFLIHEVLG